VPDTADLLSQFYLDLDGAAAPAALVEAVLEITVENSLHLPDVATVRLHDPGLLWIDDARLAPGKPLRVSAKAGSDNHVIFDGEIVEVEGDFSPATQQFVVRAFDRLHRLARGRHVRSFQNATDGDVMQRLAQEVQLQCEMGPTRQVHQYLLQNNQTNLEFLRERAAALGFLLYVEGKTLHCGPPRPPGATVALEWGPSLQEFHPRLTTVDQCDGVTVRGWDPDTRQPIMGQADEGQDATAIGEKRHGGDAAQDAFHIEAQWLVADRPIRKQAAAESLAQAVYNRLSSRYIAADGRCGGNPRVLAGAAVQLSAVGDRFSGVYHVTASTHHYSALQGYSTEFTVSGHHPATVLALLQPAVQAVPMGLVIGIVTDNADPRGQGRVKVKYPWLSPDHASDWARVVAAGAGAQRGLEFLPEVNDEVLVGFEHGDINHPYVLGGLWNGLDAPPAGSSKVVANGKVQQRLIRSRSGHLITLDDSDGSSGVSIVDKNGNKVAIDSAANSLTIEVQGDMKLKSQGNLTLEAQGEVRVKGLGVTVDAGAANATVKGSMINLN
jgi:phage protein D